MCYGVWVHALWCVRYGVQGKRESVGGKRELVENVKTIDFDIFGMNHRGFLDFYPLEEAKNHMASHSLRGDMQKTFRVFLHVPPRGGIKSISSFASTKSRSLFHFQHKSLIFNFYIKSMILWFLHDFNDGCRMLCNWNSHNERIGYILPG